jgi:hypothetical protein
MDGARIQKNTAPAEDALELTLELPCPPEVEVDLTAPGLPMLQSDEVVMVDMIFG